jgi:hypothetical protein
MYIDKPLKVITYVKAIALVVNHASSRNSGSGLISGTHLGLAAELKSFAFYSR